MSAKIYLRLFGTAFLQVMLVGANVVQIARQEYAGAFVVSFLIQCTWWMNVNGTRTSVPLGWLAYACGGACGVVTGMWVAS